MRRRGGAQRGVREARTHTALARISHAENIVIFRRNALPLLAGGTRYYEMFAARQWFESAAGRWTNERHDSKDDASPCKARGRSRDGDARDARARNRAGGRAGRGRNR